LRLARNLDIGLVNQNLSQTGSHDRVIIGDENSDHSLLLLCSSYHGSKPVRLLPELRRRPVMQCSPLSSQAFPWCYCTILVIMKSLPTASHEADRGPSLSIHAILPIIGREFKFFIGSLQIPDNT